MVSNNSSILEVRQLSKTHATTHGPLTVLREVSFTVEQGEVVAIVGPSGSGKTTLLGLCAGLDRASGGMVRALGKDLVEMNEEQRTAFRRENIGFVFQSFQLIPTLTALENVMVPLEIRGARGVSKRAHDLLGRVGLGDRVDHYPSQLSGGEQQRVALARAFINEPAILFADEPTGNLDAATGDRVEEVLFGLNAESGTTLVLVTHDHRLASRAGRCMRMRDGRMEGSE